jgi:hypothetical protein
MIEVEDYDQIQRLANQDVAVLQIKGQHYGRSWLKRGGVGAFMMLARKWDRIENDASKDDFNILTALKNADANGKDLLDDIRDLRRYLLLVESEYLNSLPSSAPPR